ncbi:MAG: flippase [Sneathiella sp.]|nr:flippase [Sneathiella sp.]
MINIGFQESLRNHLIRSASGSFIIKIASSVLAFITAILLARLLGVKEFGIYAFSIAMSQLLALPSMLGIQHLTVRETAAYKTEGAYALIRGLLRRGIQSVMLVSAAIVLLVGTIAYFVAEYLSAMNLITFWIALFLVPLSALTQIHNSALRGLGWIIPGQLSQILHPVLFLLLFGGFFLLYPDGIGSQQAIVMRVLAAILTLGITFLLLKRALPVEVKQALPEYKTKIWAHSASPMLLAGGMGLLNREISVIMLGFLGAAESVGIFRIAQRAAMIVPFGLSAVEATIAPTISSLYKNGHLERLQRIYIKSTQAMLFYGLPAALFLMVGGIWFIPVILGQDYVPATWPLIILCCGQIVNVLMGAVGILLLMTGNERLNFKGATISAIVCVIINALTIPLWGATGAAIGRSVSVVILNIMFSFWVYKQLNISIFPFKRV